MARILNISGTRTTDRGILKLAQYVEHNLTDEYTLIIGCKPSIYDVDAILIGKGNIISIECKDWKGKITGESYGWWKKDWQTIDNPLQQARTSAAALGRWLRKKLFNNGEKLWVKSLVVFTHEEGELHFQSDNDSNTGVYVLRLGDIKDWISRQKETVNSEVIYKVSDYLNSIKGVENSVSLRPVKEKVFILFIFSLFTAGFIISLFTLGFGFLGILFMAFFIAIIVINILPTNKYGINSSYNHLSSYRKRDIGLRDNVYYDPSFDHLGGNIYDD